MELQQSPGYIRYLKLLGWNEIKVDSVSCVYRTIFPFGVFVKIQRPSHLPTLKKLIESLRNIHARTIAIEPSDAVCQEDLNTYTLSLLKAGFRLNTSAFLPTKSIFTDISCTEEKIFSSFSEAKRRAVRRAIKNNVLAVETTDIGSVIHTKNISAGLLGCITTHGINQLCRSLPYPKTTGLLAYHTDDITKPIGCILLVIHQKHSIYWIAGATKYGKKVFAPTLLVWEAMKVAKRHGATSFDFLGVWDERIPKTNIIWKGFTKFKEGFGGYPVYYPIAKLHR